MIFDEPDFFVMVLKTSERLDGLNTAGMIHDIINCIYPSRLCIFTHAHIHPQNALLLLGRRLFRRRRRLNVGLYCGLHFSIFSIFFPQC
jgi:hypothetical protein